MSSTSAIDSDAAGRQPARQQPKVPGEPAPDEDKCNLPDQLATQDGDATNQPAYDKDQLRRLPAD